VPLATFQRQKLASTLAGHSSSFTSVQTFILQSRPADACGAQVAMHGSVAAANAGLFLYMHTSQPPDKDSAGLFTAVVDLFMRRNIAGLCAQLGC